MENRFYLGHVCVYMGATSYHLPVIAMIDPTKNSTAAPPVLYQERRTTPSAFSSLVAVPT